MATEQYTIGGVLCELRPVPPGTKIVDTSNAQVTETQADALLAADYKGFIFCVGHNPGFEQYNPKPETLAMLLRKGHGIVGSYGMFPKSEFTEEAGTRDATKDMDCEDAAGLPEALALASDPEGSGGVTWVQWLTGWVKAVLSRRPKKPKIAYDGYGFAEAVSTAEKDSLGFDFWWDAGAYKSNKPSQGYHLKQLPQVLIAGGAFDPDLVLRDGLTWLVAVGAAQPTPSPAPIPAPTPAPPAPATWPQWMIDLRHPLPGETRGAHIKRAVLAFVGCSLVSHPDLLTDLAMVDDPEDPAAWAKVVTNCSTTMRWLLALVGCISKWITQHDQSGVSMSWVLEAALECGALIPIVDGVYPTAGRVKAQPDAWKLVAEGWGMHYATPGTNPTTGQPWNNDHVEWGMEPVDPKTGACTTAGGGRAQNAITMGKSADIRWNNGRPLLHVIDPNKWPIPILNVPERQDPAPTPAPTTPTEPTTPSAPTAPSEPATEPTTQPSASPDLSKVATTVWQKLRHAGMVLAGGAAAFWGWVRVHWILALVIVLVVALIVYLAIRYDKKRNLRDSEAVKRFESWFRGQAPGGLTEDQRTAMSEMAKSDKRLAAMMRPKE